MADIRDFEPVLPDPRPYVEKALALYERAVHEKRGRIVFIAAELGGGKTDLLNALAQALHRAKPEPNFIAGFFRAGEYHRQTLDWQENICLRKAAIAVGEAASLLGFYPGLYAFAVGLIGQLLQTSASAHELGNEFKQRPRPGKEGADWLRMLLRRTTEERPLVGLLDDWDEAQRFYWDDMLLSSSREIAQDLPLLLFLTVKEPIDLSAPEQDESGLAMVIKTLTQKGLAEWWPLRKLSRDEVAKTIGHAAPGIAAKLHGVTGGNARWVRELWREWRVNEIVVMNEADCWLWGARHKPTINLYDDILRDRLARLLKAESAMGVEEVREVLACGALEGMRFTADAVALTLGWDRDDLIDFLDETLVQSEANPDGLLFEDDNVTIAGPDGATRTLWRYSFTSELHWLALERYGFANEQREDNSDSERVEKTTALVKAVLQTYAPEERLAAAPLARLLHGIGRREEAQHYQRQAHYSAEREAMREHAFYLLAVNKDDWEQWQCAQAAKFLIEAGKAMLDAFPHSETRAVFEEANQLAHRGKCEGDEAYARYLIGAMLESEGNIKSARESAADSLDIFRRLGKKSGIAASLHLLARTAYSDDRYDEARSQAIDSLQIGQEIGSQNDIAACLHLIAQIDFAESRYEDARRRAQQSLRVHREVGDQRAIAIVLLLLSQVDYAEGRYDDARRYAEESLAINREIGDRSGIGAALSGLASMDYTAGRLEEARRQAKLALGMCQEIGDQSGTISSLNVLARIDHDEGRYDEALKEATQLLRICQQSGERREISSALHLLGGIALKVQRPREAFELMSLSALVFKEIGLGVNRVVRNDLVVLLGGQWSEEKLVDMKQEVIIAYRKDGGKELIERALESCARLT